MIESFKHRGLKKLYEKGDRSKINPQQVRKIEMILADLDSALIVEDMDLPAYRLHPLKGNYKGFHSVEVSGNWRIIFKFNDGKASDIDLVDYH